MIHVKYKQGEIAILDNNIELRLKLCTMHIVMLKYYMYGISWVYLRYQNEVHNSAYMYYRKSH